jgi:signal peptide peptidase SppA
MKYSYVLQAFVETPWAILPHKLAVLEEIVLRHVSGEKLDAEEVQARIHGARRPADRRVNSVAVLPLFGTIFPRANLMTDVSGATSAERFGNQFSDLVNDPEIGAIILDVDSPGGHVNGIDELSTKIFEARGNKPIVAVANHTMASAAYWVGTAADEIVVTPSGEVGSIGVFAVHRDMSKAMEQDGIKVSIISEGKYKTEGNPYEPLTEEARTGIQLRVSEAYDAFIASVARNRGVKQAVVRDGFGEGRVVGARQAVESGMADRVGTLEETIYRLLSLTGGDQELRQGSATEAEENGALALTDEELRKAQALHEQVQTILRKDVKHD